MMVQKREPAVAGSFYPSDPNELRAAVQALLDGAGIDVGPAPRALIVPHAGYRYSGAVAASAYAKLLPHRSHYRRVVLLGPAHRESLRGLALPGVDEFTTPLGAVPLETAGLPDHPAVTIDFNAHRLEHSLEVQLPFLQLALAGFSLLPLVVGQARADDVADVIESLWDSTTLVVVSSDLSHYLPHAEAQRRDSDTCRAIAALDASGIGRHDACGAAPLRGLLRAAHRRGLAVRTLDLCTSGDTAGPRDRVVGYGAWMLAEKEPWKPAA